MAKDRGAFIWYELMTPDPAGAREFYRAVVGWEIDAENAMPKGGMNYRMIRRADGGYAGGVLVMSGAMQQNGPPPCWMGYIHHPDVDGAARTITQAGGAVHMGPQDLAGVGRVAMLVDPQGAPFYLIDPTPPTGHSGATSDVFSYDKAQHMRWNELQTSDPEAALSLYTGLFGWEQEGAMPMGALGEYLFLQREGGMIGAMMGLAPGTPRPKWSFYAGIDDIDRAAEAVTASGGRLAGEIMQIPGGEYSVDALDPSGAAIGLVGPRKGE